MQEAAVETIPPREENHLERALGPWQTDALKRELALLRGDRLRFKQRAAAATSKAQKDQAVQALRVVNRRICRCIRRQREAYRKRVAEAAESSEEAGVRAQAWSFLAHGPAAAANPGARVRPLPSSAQKRFQRHFSQLFAKRSAATKLGLTAERVGPRAPAKVELSGPPTLAEIRSAIASLSSGTAPGTNGLRPELFKLAGEPLAKRLCEDIRVLWPEELMGKDGGAVGFDRKSARNRVFRSWQDASVVTLFKGRGAKEDPSNYRGIFLLDVAGKVLATVVERRLHDLVDKCLADTQNGFRSRRSTTHNIFVLRRVQEAVRTAHIETYAVFVDFVKAFDSLPRGAIWECLEWLGCPLDLLAMTAALHDNPHGKLVGSSHWFKVLRGVRQGCVLGPILFTIVLEMCLRMADLDGLGLLFETVDRRQLQRPADLGLGEQFRVGRLEFADDLLLLGPKADAINEALDRVGRVTGAIGLEISRAKTVWLRLFDPMKGRRCEALREENKVCCSDIRLEGRPLSHVSSCEYLGSLVCEDGGSAGDVRARVRAAATRFNRLSGWWRSRLSLGAKIRRFKSHVLPILTYGQEAAVHGQAEIDQMAVFLNKVRRRLLGLRMGFRHGVRRLTNGELQRRCPLPGPLTLLAPRRLAFVLRMVSRPSCQLARRMLWARLVPLTADARRSIGSTRYLQSLDLDMRYLLSGQNAVVAGHGALDYLVGLASGWRQPPGAKQVLRALLPNRARDTELRRLRARVRDLPCPEAGCAARFAERKELLRHGRVAHNGGVAQAALLRCPDCDRTFQTPGWLERHRVSVHP
jgi:hypothetical protein